MNMKTFQRDRLRNMEHFQFADRVLKLCKDAGVEKLTEVLPPLEAALAREDEALNRTRALDGTEALEKLDRKRDNAYYALRLLVEMELRNDDESVVEAAKTVAEVMRRYPDTPEVNYDQETGNIKNMVGDFKKVAAAVTKINAAAAITRLDTANKAFDERYHQRVVSKTPKGTFDVKEIRAAVDKALDSVLARVAAIDNLTPDPKITDLITHYNSLIDLRRDVLARRNGSKDKKKPGGGDGGKTPGKPDEKPGGGNGGGKTPGGDKGSDGKDPNGGKTPDDGKGGKGKDNGKGKGGKKGGDDGNVSPEKALITPLLPALETELNLAHDCLAYGGVTDWQDGVTIYLVVNKRTQEEMYVKVEGGKLVVVEKKG